MDRTNIIGGAIAALVAIVVYLAWRKRVDMTKSPDRRELGRMRRMRFVIFWATLLSLAVSVWLNQSHAPNREALTLVTASFPPVAILIVLELTSRIPTPAGANGIRRLRTFGSLVVGAGAIALSYERQRLAVEGMGFASWESILTPITIDGTMVVITLSLYLVGEALRQLEARVYGAAVTQRNAAAGVPVQTATSGSARSQRRRPYATKNKRRSDGYAPSTQRARRARERAQAALIQPPDGAQARDRLEPAEAPIQSANEDARSAA